MLATTRHQPDTIGLLVGSLKPAPELGVLKRCHFKTCQQRFNLVI